MKRGLLIASALLALAESCDVLRASPFEVVRWSPGNQDGCAPATAPIGVVFSTEPDRASAESAFSIKENGETVIGGFSWDGPSLSFVPYRALEPNSDYRLCVSADARTPDGASLENPFEVEFTTKAERSGPRVLSTSPIDGGSIRAGTDPVSVTFSEPVDGIELYGSSSVSPGIPGTWRLDPSGAVARFIPLEPWANGQEYEITISANTKDRSGNRMADDHSFRFSVGEDTLAPELIALDAVDESDNVVLRAAPDVLSDAVMTVNPGWEKPWRLRARFSEPVRVDTIDSHVVSVGGASLNRLTNGSCSDALEFSLGSLPGWGEMFSVRFDAGIEDANGNETAQAITYRFAADGPGSIPPRFIGIRFPMAPGAERPEERELTVFSVDRPFETMALASDIDRFPVGIAARISFECCFELAEGATLDRLSLMECLRAYATNGALDFHATGIRLGGFDYAEPPQEWLGRAIAIVDGTLTNRAASGVFTLQFASGLKDSRGNVHGSPQKLSMLK